MFPRSVGTPQHPARRATRGRRDGGPFLLVGMAMLALGALGLAALLLAYLVSLILANSPPSVLNRVWWPALASAALGSGLIAREAEGPFVNERLVATVAVTSLAWGVAAVLLASGPWSDPAGRGIGAGEAYLLAAAAGGLVAAIATWGLVDLRSRGWWSVEAHRLGSRISGLEAVALVGVLGLFGIIVARAIAIGTLFGPDETAYAILARGLVEGTPLTGWSPHHAPLVSFLAVPALPFGDGEAAMRVVGLLAGLALLIGAWRLGRALGTPGAGVLAALVIAGIPDLQLYSSFLLTDVPAAAALVLMVFLVWQRFEVSEGQGSMLAIALVAVAAFYFRYSSVVPILLIGLTTLLIWPLRVIAAWRRVLVAGAVLLVLVLPHVVLALAATGKPWGIATLALDYAAPSHLGEALVTYLRAFPSRLAGPAAAAVMTVGVVAWLARLAIRRGPTTSLRGATLLIVPALAHTTILGITTLPQTRFIYFPISCLVIAGSVITVDLWRRLAVSWRAMTAVPAGVILVAAALGAAVTQIHSQAAEAPRQRYIALASAAIRADAHGSCSVLTYLTAFVTWYSRCATVQFGFPPEPGREALLNAPNRYLVLFAGFDPLGHGFAAGQPTGRLLTDYLQLVEDPPAATITDPVSGNTAAQVYRFRSPAPSSRP